MLFRFCLYGFLKNQRYFEPFLLLALLQKGLDFFLLGLLISLRELFVLLLEVPSGALADAFGRRRSLGLSFLSYAVSFFLLGAGQSFAVLSLGMLLFAVGEAFRTGTHKALIFAWLESEGRTDERTRTYGLTRSWSKIGSALSALIAAGIVLVAGDYTVVFYASAVPSLLDAINVLGYPARLDPPIEGKSRLRESWRILRESLRASWSHRPLRGRIVESMGFEGSFHAAKDYLQPILEALALVGIAGVASTAELEPGRVALFVAPVYFVLFLAAAYASRQAHRVEAWAGSAEGAARSSWWAAALAFGLILGGSLAGWAALAVLGFLGLHVVQNVWRPVLVSRIDASRPGADGGATILSLESQARRIAVAVLAPALGAAVDLATGDADDRVLWPVGAVGLAITLAFALTRPGASGRRDPAL